MIHIVFNEPDLAVLEEAIKLDESLQGEVVLIRDDYAVGPIANLDTAEGWQARRDWWKMVLTSTGMTDVDEKMAMVDDKLTLHNLEKELMENEREVLWIWAAQNKHDVSGYYWLMSQLSQYQGRVYILYLNNLPFINEKGSIFYPDWLSQILPSEFLKAKKLARTITPSEFEIDADEWQRISNEQKDIRLLEGGKKLIQSGVDFYDEGIDRYIGGDFVKGSRVIQQFLTKEKETTGDVFAIWRLKLIIAAHNYELRGDINKESKDFEVRNPAKPSLKKKGGDQGITEDATQ